MICSDRCTSPTPWPVTTIFPYPTKQKSWMEMPWLPKASPWKCPTHLSHGAANSEEMQLLSCYIRTSIVKRAEKSCTCVLHLLWDCQVGLLDLSGVGDVQLQDRESLGTGAPQLLSSRAILVQNPSKHNKTQAVQVFSQCMSNPSVTSWKYQKNMESRSVLHHH